jgi:hypothetical protein
MTLQIRLQPPHLHQQQWKDRQVRGQHQRQARPPRHPGPIERHARLKEEQPVAHQDRQTQPAHRLGQQDADTAACDREHTERRSAHPCCAPQRPFPRRRRTFAHPHAGHTKDPPGLQIHWKRERRAQPRNAPEDQQRHHRVRPCVVQHNAVARRSQPDRGRIRDRQRQTRATIDREPRLVARIASQRLPDEVKHCALPGPSHHPVQQPRQPTRTFAALLLAAFERQPSHARPRQRIRDAHQHSHRGRACQRIAGQPPSERRCTRTQAQLFIHPHKPQRREPARRKPRSGEHRMQRAAIVDQMHQQQR